MKKLVLVFELTVSDRVQDDFSEDKTKQQSEVT
jgi:hypothetical protein